MSHDDVTPVTGSMNDNNLISSTEDLGSAPRARASNTTLSLDSSAARPPVHRARPSDSKLDEQTSMSTSTASTGKPNSPLRSCLLCRQRKVRCDRNRPCSACTRTGADCVFPAGSGRAPKRRKRPQPLDRLRQLEDLVHRLEARVAGSDTYAVAPPSAAPAVSAVGSDSEETAVKDTRNMEAEGQSNSIRQSSCCNRPDAKRMDRHLSLDQEFGRLIVSDTRSYYVSNILWASLDDKIEDLRDQLHETSFDEDEDPMSEWSTCEPATYHGPDAFLFGYRSIAHSLRNLHPSLGDMATLISIFQDNVAPLVRIFHMPTLMRTFWNSAASMDSLNKDTEALMFSIYYSAVISMDADQCVSQLHEPRQTALKRTRFAVEQALARAKLLNTQSVTLLQAAVLYLVGLGNEDDSRTVWSLTSLIFHIAQAMGLHRDGAAFGLSPFETEIRRRLWWNICLLDTRSAEDHGCEPIVHEASFDTRLPLNVNDCDLTADMRQPPVERNEATEMTFLLIRCEVTLAVHKIGHTSPNPRSVRRAKSDLLMEERENLVVKLQRRLEERYIQYCDMSVPIYLVSATVARLIIAKMWLVVHHPLAKRDYGANLPVDTRDQLFRTSIEVIELSALLQSNKALQKWNWLFKTYVQWHAVAFILSEICSRPYSPDVERAWRHVTAVYGGWELKEKEEQGTLWRPMKRLIEKARHAMKTRQCTDRSIDQETEPSVSSNNAPLNPRISDVSASGLSLGDPDNNPTVVGVQDTNTMQKYPDIAFSMKASDASPNRRNASPNPSAHTTDVTMMYQDDELFHLDYTAAIDDPLQESTAMSVMRTNSAAAPDYDDPNAFFAAWCHPGLLTDPCPSLLWSGWETPNNNPSDNEA